MSKSCPRHDVSPLDEDEGFDLALWPGKRKESFLSTF